MQRLFRRYWRLNSLSDYYGSHHYYMDLANDREMPAEDWMIILHCSNIWKMENLTKGLE